MTLEPFKQTTLISVTKLIQENSKYFPLNLEDIEETFRDVEQDDVIRITFHGTVQRLYI
jgi:hypothetical protein